MTGHTKKWRPDRDTTHPFPLFLKGVRACTHKGKMACSSSKRKAARCLYVSRASHLKGACAPNSWNHHTNPKRVDGEDHQVNVDLLAGCPRLTSFCIPIKIKLYLGHQGALSLMLWDRARGCGDSLAYEK